MRMSRVTIPQKSKISRSSSPLSGPQDTPVSLVCVGTGVEGADMAPGSEPSHYVLHRITTSDLWQQWTEEDGKDGELRKVMAESGAWSMLATAMVCEIFGEAGNGMPLQNGLCRQTNRTGAIHPRPGVVAVRNVRCPVGAMPRWLRCISHGSNVRRLRGHRRRLCFICAACWATSARIAPSVRQFQRPPPDSSSDQLYKGEAVRPPHVTAYQSHVRLEPKHVPSSDSNNQGNCDTISDADCALKDVLEGAKKDLRDKHAVILLNAPMASYADVMVLLPWGRLLLLQCKYFTTRTLCDTNVKDEFAKMGLEGPTTQLLQSRFPLESPCLRDNVSRLIVVYDLQEDIPEVNPDTARYSADGLCNCYVLHFRPDATSNADASANEGEEARVEGDATTRAFKSSTTRLLYPVLIAACEH